MELEKDQDNIPSIYRISILGAEEILRKIESSSWGGKILIKNDVFLGNEKYEKVLLNKIEFFAPKEEISEAAEAIKQMFLSKQESEKRQESEEDQELQILFCKKGRKGNPLKIYLEICRDPYRIPFELHLISYMEHPFFPQEKTWKSTDGGESITYNIFPPEEYLAFAFYEIIKELELIKDMSWYKGVYEILCEEAVEGRKVWESLSRLMREYPIPSMEKRLDTLVSYKDYGYMQKRWKNQSKREKETYPEWEEVIIRTEAFLTPIFQGIMQDEIFLGDWMPELGRYLD